MRKYTNKVRVGCMALLGKHDVDENLLLYLDEFCEHGSGQSATPKTTMFE
jgi:hypothetical protein